MLLGILIPQHIIQPTQSFERSIITLKIKAGFGEYCIVFYTTVAENASLEVASNNIISNDSNLAIIMITIANNNGNKDDNDSSNNDINGDNSK